MTGDFCRQDDGSDPNAMGERCHLRSLEVLLDLSPVEMQ